MSLCLRKAYLRFRSRRQKTYQDLTAVEVAYWVDGGWNGNDGGLELGTHKLVFRPTSKSRLVAFITKIGLKCDFWSKPAY